MSKLCSVKSEKRSYRWRLFISICISFLTLSKAIVADPSKINSYTNIGVVYPEVVEPYKGVIDKIILGIKDSASASVKTYKLNKNENELSTWLDDSQIKTIIALGNGPVDALEKLQHGRAIIASAVITPPQISTTSSVKPVIVSYVPSPTVLFENLKELSPTTKTIHVVYNFDNSQWLIDEAKSAASRYGFQLNALQASDIKIGSKRYKDIMASLSSVKDALWLIQDRNAYDEKSILPDVLKEAWSKQFAVISTNLSHVKKGALFALYPDNERLGARLAKIADEIVKKSSFSGDALQSLKDVKIALNTRSASNIGLNINKEFKDKTTLMFPESR